MKEFYLLNWKLNALVHITDSFSPTNFQNVTIVHKSTMKTILSKRKCLFDAKEKLISDTTTKSNEALS